MENRLIVDITVEQYEFLRKESQVLGISISNYVRRAVGLPDVTRGRRSDLRQTPARKRVRLRNP
jgi:hypothetical protein